MDDHAAARSAPLPKIQNGGRLRGECVMVHDNRGHVRVVTLLGGPLGYLVTDDDHDFLQAAKAAHDREGDGAGLVAIACAAAFGVLMTVGLAYGFFHFGRWFERRYGADIHETRFSVR